MIKLVMKSYLLSSAFFYNYWKPFSQAYVQDTSMMAHILAMKQLNKLQENQKSPDGKILQFAARWSKEAKN